MRTSFNWDSVLYNIKSTLQVVSSFSKGWHTAVNNHIISRAMTISVRQLENQPANCLLWQPCVEEPQFKDIVLWSTVSIALDKSIQRDAQCCFFIKNVIYHLQGCCNGAVVLPEPCGLITVQQGFQQLKEDFSFFLLFTWLTGLHRTQTGKVTAVELLRWTCVLSYLYTL